MLTLQITDARAVAIAFSFSGTAGLLGRWWQLIVTGCRWGWDDFVVVLAWVVSLVSSTIVIVVAKVPALTDSATLRLLFVTDLMQKISLPLIKISILLYYIRIFSHRYTIRIACYGLIGVLSLFTMADILVSIFSCHPLEARWSWSGNFNGFNNAKCVDLKAVWITSWSIDMLTNIVLAVLPIYPIYQSTMPQSQYRTLLLLVIVGTFSVMCGIMRLITLDLDLLSSPLIYENPETLFWSLLETTTAHLFANLPMSLIILATLFPQTFILPSAIPSLSATNNRCSHSPVNFQPSKSDWTPYLSSRSDQLRKGAVSRCTVSASGIVDSGSSYDSSDSFSVKGKKMGMGHGYSAWLGGSGCEEELSKAIRLTTEFEVLYEQASSDLRESADTVGHRPR